MPIDDRKLCHYGVKGMKWGIRRERDISDITRVSKRKLKKQIEKANKAPKNNKNTIAIQEKFNRELNNSKEGKAYNNMVSGLAALEKEGRKIYGDNFHLSLTKQQVEQFRSIEKPYIDKGKALLKAHRDDYASAMIKDLGYEDTKDGRKYLKRLGFV